MRISWAKLQPGLTRGAFVGFVTILCAGIGLFLLSFTWRANDIENLAIANCKDNRILISNLILRPLDKKWYDWRDHPEQVIVLYRNYLLKLSKVYREDPELLHTQVTNTVNSLDLASPDNCDGEKLDERVKDALANSYGR